MATEILAVPEEYLAVVIDIIRAGLDAIVVPEEVAERLNEWCETEGAYLESLGRDDD